MADFMKFANDGTVYVLKLLDDVPVTTKGNYGDQNNYSCEYNGQEVTVSQKVGSGLDVALLSGSAGDVFTVDKIPNEAHPGSYTFRVLKGASSPNPTPKVTPTQSPTSSPTQQGNQNWDLINATKDWHITKKTAMNCAVQLADPTTELTEIEKNYHSIFLMLRKDGALMVEALNACTTLAQLADLWKSEAGLWNEIVGSDRMALIQSHKEKLKAALSPKQEPVGVGVGFDDSEEPLPF